MSVSDENEPIDEMLDLLTKIRNSVDGELVSAGPEMWLRFLRLSVALAVAGGESYEEFSAAADYHFLSESGTIDEDDFLC